MKKITKGIIFTYLGLFLNTITGLFLTPFLLRSLGEMEYGLYQLIVSFSGYLMVVNIGTGAAMNRFVSIYRVNGDKKGEQKYISINLLVTMVLMLLVLLIGIFIRGGLARWFPNVITSQADAHLAKLLCLYVIINTMLTFLANSLGGLLQAYGEVDVASFFSVAKIMIRVVLIYVLLSLGCRSVAIVIVDCLVTIFYLIAELVSLRKKCGFSFNFSFDKLDRGLLRETMLFSVANLLSGLSGQLNNNIDKTVLARYCGTFEITVYSVATTFYTMFTSLGTCLNNVFLNKTTEICYAQNSSVEDLENFNIRISRFQNFVIGAVFFGFLCVGRDFIVAWMGAQYECIFIYALLLILPNYFVCIGGVQETILDAKNKKMAKSIVVFLIGVFNLFLSIELVKRFGGIGTAIGTMISLSLGYNICLNIYLHKVIKLNVIRMYVHALKGFWLAQLLSVVCSLVIFHWLGLTVDGTWIRFVMKGFIFVALYLLFSWCIALNKDEKNSIRRFAVR